MLIRPNRPWNIRDSLATAEHIALDRRALLTAAGVLGAAAISWPLLGRQRGAAGGADPTASLYPVARNEKWKVDRPLTAEQLNLTYNNFYEFGSHKEISEAAQGLKIRPWMMRIDGLVEKPFEIGIDDLIRRMQLEERVNRHRCVEAWSMTVPWTGFPMAELVRIAKPLASAAFLRMETFHDPKVASGQQQSWYPWPYVEGITLAEATNDLAFLATGAYGKPLAKQMGAPIRLHLPWKFGFKSIKSIVRVTFTDKRPKSFWETIQSREYGFWANVNPDVPHARWSQATERVLGTETRVPTVIYNGYGEWVTHLYKDTQGQNVFF